MDLIFSLFFLAFTIFLWVWVFLFSGAIKWSEEIRKSFKDEKLHVWVFFSSPKYIKVIVTIILAASFYAVYLSVID